MIVANGNRPVFSNGDWIGKVPQKRYAPFIGGGENYASHGDMVELVNPISCKVESLILSLILSDVRGAIKKRLEQIRDFKE